MPQNLKKGQILIVKVPPFFDQEYFYEVMGAGGKVIRASLYRSPKVKKHWTMEEYALLTEHRMIRIADKNDMERLAELEATSCGSGQQLDNLEDSDDKPPPLV